MLNIFSRKAGDPGPEPTDPDSGPSRPDFLGNPTRGSDLPRYRHAFVPLGLSVRLVGVLVVAQLVSLGLVIALSVRENNRVQGAPLVFMQSALGKLIEVPVIPAEASLPTLEAFLDFVITNMLAIDEGQLVGLKRVRFLVDENALKKLVAELVAQGSRLRQERVSVSARVHQIDASSPDRFVINHRFRRAYGMGLGSIITVNATGGGRSREARWDFEIHLVNKTDENPWGFFVTQLVERLPGDPPQLIPAQLRLPEDIVAQKPTS